MRRDSPYVSEIKPGAIRRTSVCNRSQQLPGFLKVSPPLPQRLGTPRNLWVETSPESWAVRVSGVALIPFDHIIVSRINAWRIQRAVLAVKALWQSISSNQRQL